MDIMNTDGMLRLSLLEGQARAFLIESTQLVETARRLHGLSRIATAALGRTLTCTAMMGSHAQGGERIRFRDHQGRRAHWFGGNGGSRRTARVKGYVDNPGVDLPRTTKKLPVGDAVGKAGKLTVVKDLGLRDPYVGQTNLVSGEIAEDFAMYFTASEQVPSLVSLGVLVGDKVEAAGGLIIQMLPGASEAAIRSVGNERAYVRGHFRHHEGVSSEGGAGATAGASAAGDSRRHVSRLSTATAPASASSEVLITLGRRGAGGHDRRPSTAHRWIAISATSGMSLRKRNFRRCFIRQPGRKDERKAQRGTL